MAKIQCVVRDKAGCDYYRVILPAIGLQKDTEWSSKNTIEILWIGQDEWQINCDILIYNKLIGTPIQTLKEYQAKGMKLVVDVDDYWVLPDWHPEKSWNAMGNDKLTLEHIKIADIVVCSSMRIQDKIREYNKNTVVIPNAIPYGEGQYSDTNKIQSDKIRFIYAGGISHLQDVKLLEGKFRRIGSDNIRYTTEYILAGYEKAKGTMKVYSTKEDMEAGNDNYTLQTTDVRGPYDDMKAIFSQTNSYRILETLPVHKYLSHYDHADVSLVPIVANEWNSMKSNLKILEAATRKIPVICSAAAPYTDDILNNIMWVVNGDDWLTHIRWCAKNPQGVKDMGEKLYEEVVQKYHLKVWNETRKQVLESLIK
jgi:hypothetical protein